MKKIILPILILGFIVVAICLCYCVFHCQKEDPAPKPELPEPVVNQNPEPEPEPEPLLDMLLIDKEQTIPFEGCSIRGLNDKIIVLESKYCSACKVVVPILKEIEQELDKEFLHFDLSEEEDLERFEEFSIEAQWTPTVIIGCDVLIGGYSKEKYKTAIENFLNNQNK